MEAKKQGIQRPMRDISQTVSTKKHIRSEYIYDEDIKQSPKRNHYVKAFNDEIEMPISNGKESYIDNYQNPYVMKDKLSARQNREYLVQKVAI